MLTGNIVRVLVLSVCLAACAGSRTVSAQDAPDEPLLGSELFSPPALVADLFQEGAEFAYQGHQMLSFWDDSDPSADEHGMVVSEEDWTFVCVVRNVTTNPGAITAELDCGEADRDTVAATYLATPDGIYQLWDTPAADASLDEILNEAQALLSFPATAADETTQYDEIGGARHIVRSDGQAGWCGRTEVWGGDEAAYETCFAEGMGITRGVSNFAGGMVSEKTVTQTGLTAPAE